MVKLNIGSSRKSIIYRQNAQIEIKKIMEVEPFISLVELEKRTGYSRNTIASAYIRIRKSREWKLWIKNYKKIDNNIR